jgi:hypothetical protein
MMSATDKRENRQIPTVSILGIKVHKVDMPTTLAVIREFIASSGNRDRVTRPGLRHRQGGQVLHLLRGRKRGSGRFLEQLSQHEYQKKTENCDER